MFTIRLLVTVFLVHFFIILLKATPEMVNQELTQGHPDGLKIAELLEASVQAARHDYKEAINLAIQAREKSSLVQESGLMIASELNLGRLYFYLGLYQESLEFTLAAIKLAEEIGDDLGLARAYFQLGSHRLVMEDYRQARSHINLAMDHYLKYYGSEDRVDVLTRITFHNNLGLIYAGLNDLENAEKEYRKGILLSDDSPEAVMITVKLFNNLGDSKNKAGQKEEALENYLIAKNKLLAQPDLLVESMLQNSLGRVYAEMGAFGEALEAFHKGLAIAKSVDAFSHLHHLNRGLSALHEQAGYLDSAYTYLSLSKAYNDSLKLRNLTERLLAEELRADFQIEKSRLLKLYEKLKKYFFAIIILLALLLFIFFGREMIVKKRLRNTEAEKIKFQHEAVQSLEEAVKFKEEMVNSQKELAMLSLKSIRKDDMLRTISETVLTKEKSSPNLPEELKSLIRRLQSNRSELLLADFEYSFGNLYIGFFEKLMAQHPSLTPKERRLCAFVKLQLSTKEISAVTGQSIRAIEMARIRIRRKLDLTNSSTNLYDYFLEF